MLIEGLKARVSPFWSHRNFCGEMRSLRIVVRLTIFTRVSPYRHADRAEWFGKVANLERQASHLNAYNTSLKALQML